MAMKMKGASKKCSPKTRGTNWKKMGYSSYQNCMSALMSKGKAKTTGRKAPAKRRATKRTVTRKYKVGGKKVRKWKRARFQPRGDQMESGSPLQHE